MQHFLVGLNIEHFSNEFVKAFGEGSEYHRLSNKKIREKKPIQGPWSNRTMIRFVEFHKEGKTAKDVEWDEQDDPDMFARGFPLLLINAGNFIDCTKVC